MDIFSGYAALAVAVLIFGGAALAPLLAEWV